MTSEYFPRINMSNTARVLAILQIIIGLFLLGISIADVAVYFVQFLANNISGIALGMWTCFTGAVGIKATRKEPAFNKVLCVNIFACGSVTSALGSVAVGMIWLICLMFPIDLDRSAVTTVLSVIAIMICATVFLIGLWVTFYSWCQVSTCCDSSPRSQASGGGPVAFPIETGVGITALQTVPRGVQHNEPQIVLLPDSGEIDNPPPYAAAASGYQIELVDMPPSYEEAVRDEWRTYV